MNRICLLTLLFLTACAPAVLPTGTPQVVRVYTSPAAQPWLSDAYNCADSLSLILSNIYDPGQADITIRLGEPPQLATPAFKIGRDDLLVVTHSDSSLQNLTAAEVRSLFFNPEPAKMDIWVFAAGEDIQQVFTKEVLGDQPITSLARLAVSPQQMSDALNQDKNAVGILPRRLMTSTLREVFVLPNIPVLAVVKSEPQGSTKALLACLQKQ
jgi:hypothetical protein